MTIGRPTTRATLDNEISNVAGGIVSVLTDAGKLADFIKGLTEAELVALGYSNAEPDNEVYAAGAFADALNAMIADYETNRKQYIAPYAGP